MASKLVFLSVLALFAIAVSQAALIPEETEVLDDVYSEVILSSKAEDKNNLIQGKLNFQDKLFKYKLITVKGAKGKKQKFELDFKNENRKITYISVVNLGNDKEGGSPAVKEGGLGEDNVKITLTSQKGKNLFYLAGIFGEIEKK